MTITIKLIVVGIMATAALVLFQQVNPPTPAPAPAQAKVVDPLKAAQDALGIDLSSVAVHRDTAGCEAYTPNAVGCFIPGSGIHLGDLSKLDHYQLNGLVAHEYLHYIWYNMPDSDKAALVPSINAVYAAHAGYFDQRLSSYNLDSASRLNELHSYECTEIYQLPADLEAHCHQYLPNRNELPRWN